MENQYLNYLFDLGQFLKEQAFAAKKESEAHREQADKDFYDGKLLAYYEVISLMLSQATAFGIHPKELNLAGINPDRDLT